MFLPENAVKCRFREDFRYCDLYNYDYDNLHYNTKFFETYIKKDFSILYTIVNKIVNHGA